MNSLKNNISDNKRSLSSELLLWFLVLSLLPMGIIAWLNYQQTVDGLIKAAKHELKRDAVESARYVQNWFNYRFIDLGINAENTQNIELLKKLSEAYQSSGQGLSDFVKSVSWISMTETQDHDLKSFSKNYEYIHDLLLIDIEGNILYALEKETDFGSNLFTGKYSNTRFAKTAKLSISTGRKLFSDIERYEASDNQLASFLTAPMVDQDGNTLGVMAVQIRAEYLQSVLSQKNWKDSSIMHYFVGEDNYLRSRITTRGKVNNDALTKKIQTEQVTLWKEKHGDTGLSKGDEEESILKYIGPNDIEVFGVHQSITIENIRWVLLSEVNVSDALAIANKIGLTILMVFMLTAVIVILIAMYVARKITLPLTYLVDASLNAAAGKLKQRVELHTNNEIGRLADAFNYMFDKRKEYEENIEKSAHETKQALDELATQKFALDQHAIVAMTNVKGDITFVNDKFTEISGYSREELLGNNHRILNSDYHDVEFFKAMYHAIASGNVWHGEICNKAKTGRIYWVDTTIVPFMGNDGKPETYIAIRADITERKKAEQESIAAKEVAEIALEDLAAQKFALDQHAIVAITNVKGDITFVNDKFIEISGYSREELLGNNHRILNSGYHKTEFFKEMYHTIASGQVWHGEICNRSKDGHIYWVDTTIVPFMGNDGKPETYIAIRADITERKKAEQESIAAKEAAEIAFQAKGEFLASMSHEIRTPMNGVLGMLNLLTKTDLDSVQTHRVNVARSSAKALLSLINDILDFSKVEAGKLELEIIEFNLRGMLGECSESLGFQAQAKNLELILDVTGVEQSIVRGDPGRLRQILNNLVGNSIKFTKEGDVVIRAKLTDYDKNKYDLEITITDTGIGIPEEKLENLFDSFSQVDASTTRKYGGTGLGLSIVKKLSELMGGGVAVSSEMGKGSCFTINVLLDKSEQSQLVMPKVDISKLNLLVVDDSETNREVLRSQLEHWGATVDEAEDGESALALCEKRLQQSEKTFYDIALLDMQMPGMSGEELGRKLSEQENYSPMKLVIMTSMSYRGSLTYFANLGFSAYFPKPATTEDLFGALSVISTGGEVLEHASPLVTHDYLQTLIETNDNSETAWPKDTRILLVEDNQVNQIVAISTLEALGVNADVAGNGIEAINALQNAPEDAPYTLVLMDCQMPEMDGFEATRRIRAGDAGLRCVQLPIVALTANAMKEDKERCIDAGMSDYLTKPFEEKQMKEKMIKWLM